jgi:hypothetical protein
MNLHLENLTYLDPSRSTFLGSNIALLEGPGAAPLDQAAVGAARTAGLVASRDLASSPNPLGDPLHLARVALGLALLLVLPGALAARWFGVRGLPSALGVIPVLSLAMNVTSGLILLAVLRRPLTPAMGWATVGLATAAGVALLLSSRRR